MTVGGWSKDRRSGHDERWGVAVTLLEKPLTLDEIGKQFSAVPRRFGFLGDFSPSRRRRGARFIDWLRECLDRLGCQGWVEKKGETYALTEKGRRQTLQALGEIKQAKTRLEALATPENASKLTLMVHLFLAAFKLPAAILSGSVGLLNDAIDTLLDGVSSLLVYWGLRVNRERLVSRLLVLFMLATGGFALFESVRKIVAQDPVGADWFAFGAVALSAGACAMLWFVQRFIGLRRSSMAVIAQSVDSRNHIIVAGSVAAGLIAALLNFPWLDYVVGLAVAALILKSAVELAIDLVRSRKQGTANLSRYRFRVFERFCRSQLRSYMLYLIRSGKVKNKEELLSEVQQTLDFKGNVLLKAMGMEHVEGGEELIRGCYEQLLAKKQLNEVAAWN